MNWIFWISAALLSIAVGVLMGRLMNGIPNPYLPDAPPTPTPTLRDHKWDAPPSGGSGVPTWVDFSKEGRIISQGREIWVAVYLDKLHQLHGQTACAAAADTAVIDFMNRFGPTGSMVRVSKLEKAKDATQDTAT